jgi:ribosomal protein S12 methylthiotransferase
VPQEVKDERFARLMETQKQISAQILGARVGETIDVIVDEVDGEGAIARSAWDAPEIDGCVFLNGQTELAPGDRLRVRVEHADEYDLWGVPTGGSE